MKLLLKVKASQLAEADVRIVELTQDGSVSPDPGVATARDVHDSFSNAKKPVKVAIFELFTLRG